MKTLSLTLLLAGAPAMAAPTDAATAELADADEGIPGLPPGPPPSADEVDERARLISSRLRCPVCQGLSVADSTSAAAVTFQRRVRGLVAMGYTGPQIEDYFIDRYGEFILLDPPARGLNWLLWVAPALAAGVGLSWAAMTAMQWRREPDDVPLPSDVGLVAKDKYEQRLLAELDD